MNKFLTSLAFILTLASCSNAPEMETGEIRTLQLLKKAFDSSSKNTQFIDARNLINRDQIDAANIPILFVELASGRNGTLVPYPGQGVGQTWLGADGATVTLDRGVLKASRGMGDDLMGSNSFMPEWSTINQKTEIYRRELIHITGNNKIANRVLSCHVEKSSGEELLKIWDINFKVVKFEEHCSNDELAFKNIYHVDNQEIVRSSLQYHSLTLGSILIERLDQ